MQLSEHVYCVVIAFKMTEQVERQICIKFCVKLKHSSAQIIWMFQKAAGMMSNWWFTALPQQCIFHASLLVQSFFCVCETSNHPGDSAPYSPDLVSHDFWFFQKLTSLLKGKRFRTVDKIQEDTTGQLMAIGRTVCGPRCLLWRGLRRHCPRYNISCILYLLQ